MMTTYKLVKFPALVIAFRNLLLRMNLTLNLETKDFSIVFQLSNRLFTNKVAYFFQVTSQTFRCCSICTSNRRQITNVKTNWFLTMTVCTETCIVTSTLPYSTLMRLDIINYWFLTTETNLKALYIFRCFLTQPHQ